MISLRVWNLDTHERKHCMLKCHIKILCTRAVNGLSYLIHKSISSEMFQCLASSENISPLFHIEAYCYLLQILLCESIPLQASENGHM